MNPPFDSTASRPDVIPMMADSVVRELYRANYPRDDVLRFAYAVLDLIGDREVELAQAAE